MSWLDDSEVTFPLSDEEKLEVAKAAKIREINNAYTKAAKPLIVDYPDLEQATWLAQESEARLYLAWYADQHEEPPSTPVLNSILLGRNGDSGSESLYELCTAVQENADQFTAFQVLTGKRQRLVRSVKHAKTIGYIESVVF